MINITIVKSNNKIITIEATGHSGYAEHGQDIVCSAVSTLMETLANGLTEVVKAKVVAHVQDKKIVVFKYKPKKNERKKQGHRQPYTKITIESIG